MRSGSLLPSLTPTSSATKMPSMMSYQDHFSWSLSSPQEEIFPGSSRDIRRERRIFLSLKFGGWQFRCCMGSKFSIRWTSSTGTSRAPTFCWQKMVKRSSLEISTSVRSAKVDLLAPKLGPLTMPVLKSGLICPTMANVISGPWAVCFMRWHQADHLLWLMTSKDWGRRSLLVILIEFRPSILKNCRVWSDFAWLQIPEKDQVPKVSSITVSSERSFTSTPMSNLTRLSTRKWTRRTDWCRLSRCLIDTTLAVSWKTVSQRATTRTILS